MVEDTSGVCYRGGVRVHLICVRAHMERRGEQRGSFSVKYEGCERLSREAINFKKRNDPPPQYPQYSNHQYKIINRPRSVEVAIAVGAYYY